MESAQSMMIEAVLSKDYPENLGTFVTAFEKFDPDLYEQYRIDFSDDESLARALISDDPETFARVYDSEWMGRARVPSRRGRRGARGGYGEDEGYEDSRRGRVPYRIRGRSRRRARSRRGGRLAGMWRELGED